MVKKDQKWEWTERQEEVFRELKKIFIKELVLAALDLDKKNKDRSRYIRLYDEKGIIYGV